jgi:hypothetical protein
MSLKRKAFLSHRWLGVGLSALFVLWFFSGIVMMYVGFPATDHERRIAGQAELAIPSTCCESGTLVFKAPERPRLRMLNGTALVGMAGNWYAVADGTALEPVDQPTARDVTMAALARLKEASTLQAGDTRHNDQWTVPQRYDPHRPLHHFRLQDGRHIHVSGTSGEILLETTRAERGWNWVGAVIHWLYFTPIRAHPRFWAELVIWLSVAGTLLAIAGFWGGLKQLRLRRLQRGKSAIPYRGWAAWHHATGLVFGFFVITFIISGLLSLRPWGLFDREPVTAEEQGVVHGNPPALSVPMMVDALIRARTLDPDTTIREVVFQGLDGQWWARLRNGVDPDRFLPLGGQQIYPRIPDKHMENIADRLASDRAVRGREWLDRPDFYYYSNRGEPNFPVLRLQLKDGVAPWYYLDPTAGELSRKIDANGRAFRWWFNALHSLDFPWLIYFRPAWDVVVILLSLGGLVISLSGLIVGWRRLRSAFKRGRIAA